ncbi:carbamoyl-phosphate synthase small chain [Bombiscardovia nodaiensis]|uniref:Carbamoyl phosphate synthase small chain n=1 Tax=Bombiscardovia nodaiensis TaxID=2932181 RepID=A0ABM8B782_9BIFI|nr:carbamoyl-phosphate synthase small chain [Bombiscardovia nodaiensis]
MGCSAVTCGAAAAAAGSGGKIQGSGYTEIPNIRCDKGVWVNLKNSQAKAADSHSQKQALLVLEDGQVYAGQAYGALGSTQAEIVFNTGMTGYQETLTDPSYDRQIVVQTFPHIGNTGVNRQDSESQKIWVSGYVVRQPSLRSSSWRSDAPLDDWLQAQGIVGISHIDTRRLVRHLRSAGAMRAGIFSGPALLKGSGRPKSLDELLAQVQASQPMTGANLTGRVSTAQAYTVEPCGQFQGQEPRLTVAAIDLGIKAMTPHRLAERGCRVQVLPAEATLAAVEQSGADGVFFSNGPGDPSAADQQISLLRQVLDAGYPFFGICFGHQLLGRALGFDTYKLKFGHRGVNQPVQDLRTGKVEITAHNHGFAVDAPLEGALASPYQDGHFGRVRVSHVDLNDQVVEGLECLDIPAFSVQYHPEAAAGPHDASYLFERFIRLMEQTKEGQAHA